MAINKWGAYICEACSKGNHHGVIIAPLCQCTCDGRHDSHGELKDKS